MVKMIDFGVAKAINQRLSEHTLQTGFHHMIGTPLYMSPEQAEMSPLDVDTRADIYALGVLLYELLTGTTPFEKERLSKASYDEIRRIIREEEPPRPSVRLSTLQDRLTSVAAQRRTEPRPFLRLVRGELDWIVMKALEKDRNRRYETASAFAADVMHYLHDEAVQACPPSAWYRFRKFTRRQKRGLAMAACVVLALAGLAGGMGWALRDRAAREEGIERERLAREEALDQAVEQTLAETRPLMEQRKWPEALDVVERADKLLAVAGRVERPPRLLELRKDLSMAERLEHIYGGLKPGRMAMVSVAGGAGSTGMTQAEQIFAEVEFYTGREQDARFARAFREFGIDLEALEPAEAAARLGRTNIGPALVKALGQWAPLRERARGENDPGWKKLIEIARQADPDPRRNRCREALLRRDRQALEQLADTVPIRQVPPATLCLLAITVREVGALDKAMDLLRRAQHEYPTDLWINDTLGAFSWNAFRPPRMDDALRFYSIALTLRPTRPQLHLMVAHILSGKGAVEDAVLEYSKAIDLDPKAALLWNNRAFAYARVGQYDKALADFTSAIALEPKQAYLWSNRGWTYRELHQYDKAVADCSKAIELDPNMAAAWNNRGAAYADLHQYEKALTDCSKAIELDPKMATAWNVRGGVYGALHQYEKALTDCSKAIELDPRKAGAWSNRGGAYVLVAQYDKALADFTSAIALEPKQAYLWSNRGWAYRELHQYDKAVADCSKAIELDPNMAAAWNNRGLAYSDLHQYEKAVANYSKAIDLDPKMAAAWNNRGAAYSDLHQYEKALADLNKAIDLEPKAGLLRYHRGRAYTELHQWDKATADFSKAIELNPTDSWSWYLRALVRLQLGDRAGYRKACAAMLAHFGSSLNPEAVNLTAWTCIQIPDGLDDWSRLVQLTGKTLAADRDNHSRLTTLGAVLYRAGRFQEAARRLTEAEAAFLKAKDPAKTMAYTCLFLAMTQQRLGHAEQAKEWLAKAVREIDQPSPERAKINQVWFRRLTLGLLRREAEALVGRADNKTDHQGSKDTQRKT
jgi:tetratricopeptide (TPR) repeat protein